MFSILPCVTLKQIIGVQDGIADVFKKKNESTLQIDEPLINLLIKRSYTFSKEKGPTIIATFHHFSPFAPIVIIEIGKILTTLLSKTWPIEYL